MLLSVGLPDRPRVVLGRGCVVLGPDMSLLSAAVGFALFDAWSHLLPRSGQVDVQLAAPLDGRAYRVSRALDVPEHWQVHDVETGWPAAAGEIDARRWLHANLDVPDDLPLQRLFQTLTMLSLPRLRGWLVEEPALRERKLAALLRLERYRTGTRWLDEVIAQTATSGAEIESVVRRLEGRDQLLVAIRERYEADRASALRAAEAVARLELELAAAQADEDRLRTLQAELAEVRHELDSRRLALAGADAEVGRWRHWLVVRDRALKVALDHQEDWQAYNDAALELAKLEPRISGLDAVQAELQTTTTDVLALQRELVLVEGQLALIRQAETAAGDLLEQVHHQQQIEQQLSAAQERALRLDQVNRALQSTLADAKRIEVQLGEVERQLAELEQLEPRLARIRKIEQELAAQQAQLLEAGRQVDHLHFLEAGARSLSGYLDDLRKGASASERLAVKAGAGNGANEERTVVGHLREAIDHQVTALERQVRDWQAQSRDLAAAPLKVNQLRTSIHQLEQELAATRKTEVRLGGAAALKLHRKQLRERSDELRKLTEAYLKEQQGCVDAPAAASQLRQELTGLNDPRSERLGLLREAGRKDAVEAQLRQLQRSLQERTDRQTELRRLMDQLQEVQAQMTRLERGRDETRGGFCQYLAQQAVIEVASAAEQELATTLAAVQDQQRLLQQAEARETSLLSAISEIEGAPLRAAALAAQLTETEVRSSESKARHQLSSEHNSDAEEHRAELQRRQQELATHHRAQDLLRDARAVVQEAEALLSAQLRGEAAAVASTYVRLLMDHEAAEMEWRHGEAPALIRAGASQAIDELSDFDQACCVLAFGLALAAGASRLGTVVVSGLGSVPGNDEIQRRLPQLPGFDQFLLASGW